MYPAFCSGQAATVKPAPAPDCIREVGALVYRVDSVCLEQYLDNLALVARDITVRPHFENGRCVGQEIVNIGADSVFLELGLKAGDIITDANGKPLNGAAPPPVEPYEEIKRPERLLLDLLRNHEPTTVRYEFD